VEGLRPGRGTGTLDENETDDPRVWALDPNVVRALQSWQKMCPARPFEALRHAPELPRADLLPAGPDRPELHESTWGHDRADQRSPWIRHHRPGSRTAAELHLGPLAPLHRALGSEWAAKPTREEAERL
jgi:hypothetical protein